jgi:hypothetical protein
MFGCTFYPSQLSVDSGVSHLKFLWYLCYLYRVLFYFINGEFQQNSDTHDRIYDDGGDASSVTVLRYVYRAVAAVYDGSSTLLADELASSP